MEWPGWKWEQRVQTYRLAGNIGAKLIWHFRQKMLNFISSKFGPQFYCSVLFLPNLDLWWSVGTRQDLKRKQDAYPVMEIYCMMNKKRRLHLLHTQILQQILHVHVTDIKEFSFPKYFHSRVDFLFLHPCLVPTFFTGPSLRTVHFCRNFSAGYCGETVASMSLRKGSEYIILWIL